MKARLFTSFAISGIALLLLSGCVSSRKYKASQEALAKSRNDSSQLAQEVTTLNGSVRDLQDKNTALQHSLDNTTSSYAAQQKSLDYYQGYFKEQQDTLAQVSQDVKGVLTGAGIANGDVQQTNNAVYVRFDENDLFKKNSTMVTPAGKQVLEGLAQVIRSRSRVNVAVSSGDSAAGWVATDNMPSDETVNAVPRHHRIMHPRHSSVSASAAGTQGGGAGGASTAANTNSSTEKNNAGQTHRRVHHRYSSEGSMATMYNGPGHMHNHAWALKQGRMVTVANHFLKNGVPKINVSLQQPPMNGVAPGTDIKIIITPKMENFNPQNNPTGAVGTR